MKIQDLQQPYRALAEMRREQQIDSVTFRENKDHFIDGFEDDNELQKAFNWMQTREEFYFWEDINYGKLPEIPAESLAELKEWQKEHPEYDAVLIAEQPKAELSGTLATCSKPDPRLFTAAVAAMQGMLASNRTDLKSGEVVEYAWHLAEALINEGKKRNLL